VIGKQYRLLPGRKLTILLALFTTLGPYSTDAFFPAMRAMGTQFGVSTFQIQQGVTAFLLPFGIASLVHGSISDALGRRRVLLTGLLLYILAAVGCGLVGSYHAFIVLRVCQGLVAGTGMIIARAIVRDLYSGANAQRAMGTMTMVFSLGPAFAPVIGGWLQLAFGWRSVFLSMAVVGLLLAAAAAWLLPETLPPEKRVPMHLGQIVRRLAGVLRHRRFLRLTAASILCFIVLQMYIGAAPAIILDHWHGSERSYSMLTLPVIGGYMLGGFISNRFAGRVDPIRQANIGFGALLATTSAMVVLQWAWPGSPWWVQAAVIFCTTLGLQLVYPVMMLQVLDLFPNALGTATSGYSFLALLVSSMTMGVLAPLIAHSMLLLALVALSAVLAGWACWELPRLWQARTPA
jgi:DHA1 family bicyclomycin/chloramphenicol resistance-like MFS transporter